MEESKKQIKVIDLNKAVKQVWQNRKLFYKVLPLVFIISCIYIFSIPRYYSTDTKLAPEVENSLGGGALSSIASSFGLDINDIQTSDAITPLLYPDLMDDNGFIASLFPIKVKSTDGEINTTYYEYIAKKQKKPWWLAITNSIKRIFTSPKDNVAQKTMDPYNLDKFQDNIVSAMRDNISISVNSKNGVISIATTAQDPLISKTLADSVREKLQLYITTYRTNKARTDWEYYKRLTAEAKQDYEKARQRYASTSDASTNISLRSVELKLEDLENDMQLKFNAYTNLNNQLQAAKAKVQERTPAFTILKGAAVPIKPAGPKRMIFVAAMLFLSFVVTALWILRKNIADIFA